MVVRRFSESLLPAVLEPLRVPVGTHILETEKVFRACPKPDGDDHSIPSISFFYPNELYNCHNHGLSSEKVTLRPLSFFRIPPSMLLFNLPRIAKVKSLCTEPRSGFIAGISFSGGLAFARAGRSHIPYNLHLMVLRLWNFWRSSSCVSTAEAQDHRNSTDNTSCTQEKYNADVNIGIKVTSAFLLIIGKRS